MQSSWKETKNSHRGDTCKINNCLNILMLINQEKDRIISDYMLGKLPNKTFEELRGDINQEFLNSLLEENDILERYRSFAKADAV